MVEVSNNQSIARMLFDVAAVLEVTGGDRFRIRAYQEAAKSIESYPVEIRDLWEHGNLGDVSGVGKAIAGYLDEFFKTGRIKHFEPVIKKVPAGMFPLLNVSGIGPKTAFTLSKVFGLGDAKTAVEKLKKAATDGKIAKIEGFGEESQSKILSAIGESESREDKMLLPVARELADKVVEYLKNQPGVLKIGVLGSLRRQTALVGDIDIGVAAVDPKEIADRFVKFPEFIKILASGDKVCRAIHRTGRQVDLKIEPVESFGSMLQHFTGSKEHNIALREFALKKGYSLSEHGIKKAKEQGLRAKGYPTEEEFYKALGIKWIPPELRENRGEIEAGTEDKLPKLIDLSDIKGDFHIHSDFDIETSHDLGSSGLIELIESAKKLGYGYIAISDHNPSTSRHNNKQIIDLIKRRNEFIDKFLSSRVNDVKINIFKSIEIDISGDGSIAIPDEALELLDFAIVSVHSQFVADEKRQTDRILRALAHPKVRILGHPTGRQLLKRNGIKCDWDQIFDYCAKNNIWLEVNGNPFRMDLPDLLIQKAKRMGVKFAIGTDSHASVQMEYMPSGISLARRGWLEKSDVINALGYNEIKKILNP
jgi:DNA polymerase (family 10)